MITSPESIAARRSIPVPISGGAGLSSGTAWRCMFEPIRARVASSCSRNGISEAAADQHLRALEFAGRLVELGVRLGDDLVLLLRRVVADDLVGDNAVLHEAVGGGDETMLGDLRVGRERSD